MRANSWSLLTLLLLVFSTAPFSARAAEPVPARPNVLWISLEDTSPDLGCYGDKYATTPILDKFATESVRYTRCFTHAGVCAPSRSGIITGMYPPGITTQHMRCDGVPPPNVRCFTEYLRGAGYYCTNNSKTDYQFAPPITAWDENGNKAHWKNRGKDAIGKEQPFFAVFNLVSTHESQIRTPGAIGRKLPADKKHDPAKAVLPPYYPDTPLVRQDWANYYDNLTATEDRIAALLKELDDAGLREETIVWIWGDHGRGLPRAKRWLYDSGVHVPLLIRIPGKWRRMAAPHKHNVVQSGQVDEELHAFVDFAPTMLSLCGLELPKHLQGQAFLGPKAAVEPREFVFGHRDRMDERYDLIRMARDKRFKYIHNFRPDLPYAQHINYMDEMPTMQEWRRLAGEGKLNDQQKIFFTPYKPIEELYDTQKDPHELVNLAADPKHQETLELLRHRCYEFMTLNHDTGLIREAVLDDINHLNGKPRVTPQPQLQAIQKNGGYQISFAVPNGGSVGYRILKKDQPQKEGRQSWLVAIDDRPIAVAKDESVVYRGVRLGFQDSPEAAWKPGQTIPDLKPVEEPNLRIELIMLNLACSDYMRLNGGYFETQTDPKLAPAEKLRKLIQIFRRNKESRDENFQNAERSRILTILAELRYVQKVHKLTREDLVAACKAEMANDLLAQLEEPAAMRAKYLEILKTSKNEYERLDAALALDDLGEEARPALDDIETSSKADDYAGRVCKFIVMKLKK